jgi:hypothetical protein
MRWKGSGKNLPSFNRHFSTVNEENRQYRKTGWPVFQYSPNAIAKCYRRTNLLSESVLITNE